MAVTEHDSAGPRRSGSSSDDGLVSFLRELPVLLLVAFLLAFLLRTFVLQVFYIPSGSMEPTLQVDDRMVVEKLSYLFGDIERGDVVVFAGEELVDVERSTADNVATAVGRFLGVIPADARDFVKRVIGLPGETITIEGGVVSVEGVALDEPFVTNVDERDFGPYVVPEDSLFVMGDNRPNSADSRFGLGFVPIDKVVGRAAFVIWPFEAAGGIGDQGLDEQVPYVE